LLALRLWEGRPCRSDRDRLAEFPEFAGAIGLIEPAGDLDERVAELGDIFARVYLANITTTLTVIAFIHGVTSLHAIGNILPQVSGATGHRLVLYGWQGGCGLYSCFGNGAVMAEEVEPMTENPERLIDRAVANGDEHPIKFTEACLHLNTLYPSAAYPLAVRHALGALGQR
jgi:hypothetical protein